LKINKRIFHLKKSSLKLNEKII